MQLQQASNNDGLPWIQGYLQIKNYLFIFLYCLKLSLFIKHNLKKNKNFGYIKSCYLNPVSNVK